MKTHSIAEVRAMTKKPHKYRAKRTEVDGILFHSKREAKRYLELKVMERERKITALELQPSYDLTARNHLICKYVADFRYYDNELGMGVVEDCKGYKTAVYRLKKKLMLACHGIIILET